VDIVMKVDPIRPAKIVYSTSNIPLILSQPCFAGSSPVVKKIRDAEAAVPLHDFVPAAGNFRVKQTDRGQRLPIMIEAWMKSVQTTALMPRACVDRRQMTMAIVDPM